MATASRRLTRKDLRQPDWFQVATEKAIEFYAGHRAKVLAAGVGFVVLLLAMLGWQMFKERQNTIASAEFGQAIALFQEGKHREAVAAFEKVEAYRWSHYAALAYLYQANSFLAIKDFDKAISAGHRFVSATKPESLYRQIGLVTLANAEEQKRLCKEASGHYAEAEKISGPFRASAIMGRARCAEQLGDVKSALAAYKDYVREQPASMFSLRVAELEGKLAAQPAGK
ncbi:MAG: tetratricopeptide repeat protein [Deltaproteobacteria bacterium]|nr:tetratricopeptide repeat protein [Deltaproteobacteria bacterium]MDZ4342682.1 tetratricopeptide repeat protein [Candidatus Binatia bacterium]